MRFLIVLLAAGSVMAPLAGCTADRDRSAGPAPSWSGSSAAGPGQTPGTPPPGPGELPGELPHSDRLLTGVVERSGDCTMLRVGARLWGLSGTLAEKLAVGDRVTVAGQVGSPDPACAGSDVLRGLVVRRVA